MSSVIINPFGIFGSDSLASEERITEESETRFIENGETRMTEGT